MLLVWVLFLFGVLYHKLRFLQFKNLMVTSFKNKSQGQAHPLFLYQRNLSLDAEGFWITSGKLWLIELNLQFSSFIFIREWEWNSKHSNLELTCVTLFRVIGSVFFQWETLIHKLIYACYIPCYSFLVFSWPLLTLSKISWLDKSSLGAVFRTKTIHKSST